MDGGRKVKRRDVIRGSALAAGSISLNGCRSAAPARSTVPGIGGSPAAAGAVEQAAAPAVGTKRTAVDRITLGSTGLQTSRLAFGTGAMSGDKLRGLGRERASKLMRYAFERGITFIDTAKAYDTHDIVKEAMRGLDRERFFVMTKMPNVPQNPLAELDRYRSELGTDYIDLLLVHCARTPTWDDDRKRVTDALLEAQHRQIIRSRGVSCHGLPALRRAVEVDFPQVHLVRVNPIGVKMDGEWQPDRDKLGDVTAVTEQVKQMRAKGRGVIGMKLLGEGQFKDPEERERSIRFVMQSGLVDAVTIGFEHEHEVDEAIERINRALAS